MKDINFDSNAREKMIIETSNKRCEIAPYLSMADMIYVTNMMNAPKESTPLELVSSIISKHTEGVFSKEEILSLKDDTLNKYIELCVKRDSALKAYFDGINSGDQCERFIRAIIDYKLHLDQQNQSQYMASLASIQNQLSNISKNKISAMEPMLVVSNIARSIVSTSQEIWKNSFQPIVNRINNFIDYSSIFGGIRSSILEIIKAYKVSSIPEAEKERLIAAYTQWGEFGWTLPPNAGISTLSNFPSDAKMANAFFASYITKDRMNEIFLLLSNMKRIKKPDIQEAIECFSEKHYKSCAMILFSIIDARLIRLQDKAQEGKRRPTGRKAAKILFEKIMPQSIDEDLLFNLLNHLNIISALENVFEDGNDFKVQPNIINRNFLDHGMLHRRVSRRDCCMLFLLLYNFTLYINAYIDGES